MPYETILFLHIGAFVFNISLVVFADLIGLLWMLRKIQRLPKRFMLATHRFIWLGLLVSVISGAVLFWDLRDYLLTVPAFYTKMLFLLALLTNSVLISKHLKRALELEYFSDLDKTGRRSFFTNGVVSLVCWIAVFISANMLGL